MNIPVGYLTDLESSSSSWWFDDGQLSPPLVRLSKTGHSRHWRHVRLGQRDRVVG
jgi:hypothetical protein